MVFLAAGKVLESQSVLDGDDNPAAALKMSFEHAKELLIGAVGADVALAVLENADEEDAPFDDNIISDEQWEALEKAGVVFLPAAGLECGGIDDLGTVGNYWTSSPMGHEGAMNFQFFDEDFFIDEVDRFFRFSIRLAREVK